MSVKLPKPILSGTLACAAVALGLAFSAPAQAQPYVGGSEYYAPQVGGLVVTAPYRHERTFDGAPVEIIRTRRVVPIGDLDLSTRWGVHELRVRVDRAAASACNQLDNMWTMGLYPLQGNDADCYARAVDNAMAAAPISYRYEEGPVYEGRYAPGYGY